MARDGLYLLVCAGLVLAGPPAVRAAPDEESESRLRNQLAVQAALQQGLDHLQRGNYQAAVYVLESQVPRIDGNRRYLAALRDAYRGYVRELQQSNRTSEVPTYLHRLEILDPGSRLELAEARPTRPAEIAAPPPPSKPPATSPRPKLVERSEAAPPDDPFSDANSRLAQEARQLLSQAEQEFRAHRYAAAGRLYDQAHRADPASARVDREQWAYCKLQAVADVLNRGEAGELPPPGLEHEVRQAMSLAPKLERAGQDLLDKIRERQAGEARVAVRHLPRQGQGWALAETANFRILHTQSPQAAERVARTAEATRAAMTRKWFGSAPGPWQPRCDIYLHGDTQDYTRATGAPAESPGHSTLSFDAGRVVGRRIDLRCDDPHLLDATLPHETTHVVLADRFSRRALPKWADEGMAVLTEPPQRIDLYLRNLSAYRQQRHLFGLHQLMGMEDYPNRRDIDPFYAQSVSLVGFLCQREDPQVFTRFLHEVQEGGGYEAALRRHYGFQSFEELEQQWAQFTFSRGTSTQAVARKRQ